MYFGLQPSSDFALPVSMTTEVRPTCNHSSAAGTNGAREITAEAAAAAAWGTRTGRPPSAETMSDTEMTPSPAML